MNTIKEYRQETNRPPMVSVLKGTIIDKEFEYHSKEYVEWLEGRLNQEVTVDTKPCDTCPECFDGMTHGSFCSNCGRALSN